MAMAALFVTHLLVGQQDPAPEDSLLESARSQALPVAKALTEALERRLVEAMGQGGPVAAIEVCQEQALILTETVREEKDILSLKRVGVRVRNPANAPDAAEQRALQHFLQKGGQKGQFPGDWVDSVTRPDGSMEIRYYKAIAMQARCLACHGPEETIPELIRSALDERYPSDQARGFQEGDLRGLLVVGLEPTR